MTPVYLHAPEPLTISGQLDLAESVTAEVILAEWYENTDGLAGPHLNRAAAALHAADRMGAAEELELAAACHGDGETGDRLCRMAISLARTAGQLNLTGDGHGNHIPGTPDEWRHGYIPLTDAAARSHGHGKVPEGWHPPGGSRDEPPTHTGLYHATPAAKAASIRRDGFRATSGSGQNGAFFGAGTYFHTSESDAKESLEGYRAFIDSSMEHVRANATVHNPFTVPATSRDWDPDQVMQRALTTQGVTAPGEHLSPAQVTARLKSLGYDGVEVRQDGFNHDIGGSQLVAFDPSQIQVQP